VETVAAAVRYATASADRAMAAVAATELQLQLARTRYKVGASSFLEVIVAEQAVFAARQEMIGTEAEAARSLAALFGAMGLGGEA
jgi:outer membrane protein TolC